MIGQAVDRVDGPLKVTGRARYSYERHEAGHALYGMVVGATIGKGRTVGLDTKEAEDAPGVRGVWTHLNAPEQGVFDASSFGPRPMLTGPDVKFFGEPVAFVVADTFEQARAAAALVKVTYSHERGEYDLASRTSEAYPPAVVMYVFPTDSIFGDLEGAMDAAPTTVDETYAMPYQFAMAMEPPACTASWDGDDLTVFYSTQLVQGTQFGLASTLLMPPERVHIDAAYVGGGFGSKILMHAEAVLSSLAAKALGRPVKTAFTRRQMFTLAGHRPAMIQRVRLAADVDGRLTGLGHDVTMQSFHEEEYSEQAATVARSLYAAPNRMTRHRLTNLDIRPAEALRGPGEQPGLLAFESGMDELAHRLGIDPVELRLRNDTQIDPELDVPLSARRLADCLTEGAARFGWEERPTTPASRRDGDWLVGFGMASMIRQHVQAATQVRVRIEGDGRARVQTDMTDIGTGAYTIAAQVAAEGLGVPLASVTVELARSELPVSGGAGGSWGAANVSVAIDDACRILKGRLSEASGEGVEALDPVAAAGAHFPEGIEAIGEMAAQADSPNYTDYSIHSYGATFVEIGVDVYTGEARLRRMLGVFACGRIMNPKTARSQLMGGLIWGVSSALHEGAHVDPRYGNWVNGDLAEYVVPVHADIPEIDVVMLEDFDPAANRLGMKGLGEVGICGSGAAVANAVFNATGVRVRDFPITLDKLLAGLPAA